jgi:hypothetical protein
MKQIQNDTMYIPSGCSFGDPPPVPWAEVKYLVTAVSLPARNWKSVNCYHFKEIIN